jgi:hypothetical protein
VQSTYSYQQVLNSFAYTKCTFSSIKCCRKAKKCSNCQLLSVPPASKNKKRGKLTDAEPKMVGIRKEICSTNRRLFGYAETQGWNVPLSDIWIMFVFLWTRFALRVAFQPAVTNTVCVLTSLWEPLDQWHSVTTSKTWTLKSTALRTSNLALWHKKFDIHSHCVVGSRVRKPAAVTYFSPKRPNRLCNTSSLIFDARMGSFPRVKLPEREVHDSYRVTAEAKNKWRFTPSPPTLYIFRECTGTILSFLNRYFNQL